MADISKITLPNGSSYDFKDSVARSGLAGKAASSHTHSEYALKANYGDNGLNLGRLADSTIGFLSSTMGRANAATGGYSFSQGFNNVASGVASFAGGQSSTADGENALAHGYFVQTTKNNEKAFGAYNKSSPDTMFSVGDGTAANARHNAFEITTTGGKLHDKDIATTDMSLPANGGNADTVGGIQASDIRQITRNTIQTLPSPPSAEGDYFVSYADSTFPYPHGNLSIRYGSHTAEFVAIYQTTGDDKKIWFNVYRGGGWSDWRNSADGGIASTISEWGSTPTLDLNTTNLGFVAASEAANAAPNTFWSTVLSVGLNDSTYRVQLAFPWSSQSDQYMKYRVLDNGVWHDWKEIYSSGNKPYVTGSATIAAGDHTCITNHGFTPSAVLWWENSGGREIRSASSFNTTSFNPSMIDTSERVLNYIIFK